MRSRWVVTLSAAVLALTACSHETQPIDADGTQDCATGFQFDRVAREHGLVWATERSRSYGVVFPVALCLYDVADPPSKGAAKN